MFLIPCLTFFIIISHLMSPSLILLQEQLGKVRRHLSKQSNIHFNHSLYPRKGNKWPITPMQLSNTNAKGCQWQNQTSCTTFCVYSHAHFTSMSASRTDFSITRNCRFENTHDALYNKIMWVKFRTNQSAQCMSISLSKMKLASMACTVREW